MKADFEAFLEGFSPNVQVILDNFEFRNQVPKLSKADVLGTPIEKFLDSSINLCRAPITQNLAPRCRGGQLVARDSGGPPGQRIV